MGLQSVAANPVMTDQLQVPQTGHQQCNRNIIVLGTLKMEVTWASLAR